MDRPRRRLPAHARPSVLLTAVRRAIQFGRWCRARVAAALRELIALLQEIDERYLGDEWGAPAFGDLVDGFRSVANMLEGGFFLSLRQRPGAAVLPADRQPQPQDARRQPRRALLHGAGAGRPVVPGHRQPRRLRLPLVHRREGSADGGYSTETAGVLRDRDFDIAADGSFEVFFGGRRRDRNWLGAGRAARRS